MHQGGTPRHDAYLDIEPRVPLVQSEEQLEEGITGDDDLSQAGGDTEPLQTHDPAC
jgi:hypothetical protein